MMNSGDFSPPAKLFDEFWREGELALLFGAAGTGKSVLAVQIADALARGRALDGFRMPAGRRKVLYVDLVLRDVQFQARYSVFDCRMPHISKGGSDRLRGKMSPLAYKFAENLYRARPPVNDELCEWLREMVRENGYQAVIVDDLSAIQRTHDGTRETLSVMRELEKIRDELNVSILVLTGSESAGRSGSVSEHDLRRSRVLCNAADSVFAIGSHPRSAGEHYLVQTRSRSAPIFWNGENAPICRMTRTDAGMLGFLFDERFAPRMDDDLRRLICTVRSMRDGGATYRAIAKELEISKSRAARLYKKWTPAMECGIEAADPPINDPEPEALPDWLPVEEPDTGSDEIDEWEEAEFDKPVWIETEAANGQTPGPHEMDVHAIPFAAGLARRTVYDLKRGFDGYGREIYIESEEEYTGKPKVWYQFDKLGIKVRFERKNLCITIDRLDASPYL